MNAVTCRVPHKPDEGKYGDCLRACVASILDLDASQVPNFADDNADGDTMFRRLRDFLARRNLVPVYHGISGSYPFAEIMKETAAINFGVHSILLCATDIETGHAVVVKDGKVVHDPSWGGRRSEYHPMPNGAYCFIYFGALV